MACENENTAQSGVHKAIIEKTNKRTRQMCKSSGAQA